jgi:hypothetical protein
VNGDRFVEADETFAVTLSSPVGTTIADGQAVGRISNDDHAPLAAADKYTTPRSQPLAISAAGVLANDTDADGDVLTAALVLSPSHGVVALQPDGSFLYTPTVGYVGSDSFTYQAGDGTNWSSAAVVNVTMSPPPPPGLSVNEVSVTEGNSGTTNLTFTITRSGSTSGTATVHFATSNSTATSGTDYVAASGTITFSAGVATVEGASGQKAFTFKVTLDKASTKSITVKFATADGTAKLTSDYVSKSGTLAFAAGQMSQTITVYVKGDKTKESNENFLVKLSSAVNATLGASQATGLIQNDD